MRNPSMSSAKPASTVKTPCCTKVGLKRGPWTPEEDELLVSYIKKEGEGRWRTLPKRSGLLRCGKSCRLRWMNYLRPSVKRGQIVPDEEDLILRLHRLLGNRWSLIAGRIPGRTDNEIKNYWNTHLSKKLISQGIDPRTHKPLNPESATGAEQLVHKPSSSKTNRKSSSPKPSGLEETTSGSTNPKSPIISNKENGDYYFHNSSLDQNNQAVGNNLTARYGYTSLLNSDASARNNTMQQAASNNGMAPAGSDPLVSVTTSTFGLANGWESAIMSSALNQNDPNGADHDLA
ncbi:hypothetical protein K2173_008313 [Erythroxylum novogranatense]|uniref:Uncharacterized protein n=1 Tax=Erythroxylum novogranatense TaxID=1862640 RepID=A0AAV8U7D3_9ROSI|nr:hypothetical protein K2173_008313 [Erythroxylum novogranatense]